MISTESALPWKAITSLTWRLSIITDAGKEAIHMSNRIPTPTMGEILMEEFMGPMNLSAYKLAQSIHVPTSRIQDISMQKIQSIDFGDKKSANENL
jgi:hypothetical protein